MAKVEVDEAEWLASQQVTKLFADTLNNPESRRKILEAKKIVRPNEPVPEIDAAAPIQSELAKIREEIAADRKAREEAAAKAETESKTKEFQAAWDKQKQSLRADFDDTGVEAIEKLAQERGIADLEAAALLYRKLHPEPTPVEPSGYGRWNTFEVPTDDTGDAFMKKMIDSAGNNESALDAEIRAAIDSVRGASPQRR